MGILFRLAMRDVKVYLRDRTSVFFSFLSVLVIIGMYALFLGDTTGRSIENAVGGKVEGVRWLVDAWIMAGILVVNAQTVTLGALGVLVEDESRKRLGAFLVAPIRRSRLVQGYLLAAMIVGLLLGTVTLVLTQVYIVAKGGQFLPPLALLRAFALQVLNVFSSGCIVFFFVSFVRTPGAFGTLSTIMGTMVGFLAGIYLPVGVMPTAVQAVMKFIPLTHAAALMRQVFMEAPMDQVFAGAPAGVREEISEIFGVTVKMYGSTVSEAVMMAIVAGSGVLFLVLSVLRMNRRRLG
ncbi:MAG TPA: ABC transporter permease [Clostridia bacterium]